jgi:hypothetical protein
MALEKMWIADDEGFLRLAYTDGERVFYDANSPFREASHENILELLESIRRINRHVLY